MYVILTFSLIEIEIRAFEFSIDVTDKNRSNPYIIRVTREEFCTGTDNLKIEMFSTAREPIS